MGGDQAEHFPRRPRVEGNQDVNSTPRFIEAFGTQEPDEKQRVSKAGIPPSCMRRLMRRLSCIHNR